MVTRNHNAAAFEYAAGENGILLLHGFSGTPAEIRELGARLHSRGYGVSAPALPGHAGHTRSLDETTIDDYLQFAESAFDVVRRRYRAVYVVGFSMGGTLGLHLAQRRLPNALVTINAPIELSAHVHSGVPLVAKHAARVPLLVNPRALFGHPGQPAMPAHAVATFLGVLERVKAGLAEIEIPLLVVQGARDETVPVSNANAIVAASGARSRSMMVPNAPHLLTMGRWLDVIEPAIASFLSEADRGQLRDARSSAGLP